MRDLFTVGPVNRYDRTVEIARKPIPYFRTEEFSERVLRINRDIKELLNAPDDAQVILLTASGTGAMEACVANFCQTGTRALVVNGGTFGARFVDLCVRYGAQVTQIAVPFEGELDESMLAPYMAGRYDVLFVNIHETSIGKLYDRRLIARLAKETGALLVIDAISSFLADRYDMSEIGADATIVSSQKALALDAGLSVVTLSPRAVERATEIGFSGMYFDFPLYLKDAKRGQTPFTPAVGTILQLEDRLAGIVSEGIQTEWNRCASLARYFRRQICKLPFTVPSYRLSDCLTPIKCARNDARQLTKYLAERYDIYVTPSGGENADKLLRIGHIGKHDEAGIDRLIEAMEEFYQ